VKVAGCSWCTVGEVVFSDLGAVDAGEGVAVGEVVRGGVAVNILPPFSHTFLLTF